MSTVNEKNTPEPLSFATFLESVPPGTERAITDLFGNDTGIWHVGNPDIQLHCPNDICRGVRIFECRAIHRVPAHDEIKNLFLTYTCRNCKKCFKTYALRVQWEEHFEFGSAVKYGEIPAFGPPLPARLINMAGSDGDLLRKGRRSENQSLGIGAFAYYRLVVENQKHRLLADIRKAAVRLGADEEQLRSIDLAGRAKSFSKAIDLVKEALPVRLMVKGHNPLTLLHDALSKGVHSPSDEKCLEQAHAVRIVLTELVSNISQVNRDDSELDDAVSKLLSQE